MSPCGNFITDNVYFRGIKLCNVQLSILTLLVEGTLTPSCTASRDGLRIFSIMHSKA